MKKKKKARIMKKKKKATMLLLPWLPHEITYGMARIMKKKKKARIMKKKKKATTMLLLPWLPHEITLFHILSKLPVRCLLKFTCVSKLWYNTIHHDPNFIASHFTHAKSNPSLVALANFSANTLRFLNLEEEEGAGGHHHPPNNSVSHLVLQFESIHVVGNCNGLTCNSLKGSSAIQIINPSTRELLTFPQPKLSEATKSFCTNATMKHGFGFDPLKNEYKVIQMCVKDKSEYYVDECWVYTLGGGGGGTTNLWRNITATCNYLPSCFPINLAPICIRGVLFWWCCSNSTMDGCEWILSFDLRHEKFQLIPCPQVPQGSICDDLIELEEGRPCLVYSHDGIPLTLYMLNEEDHLHHLHHLNVMHEDSSTGSWIRLGYYIRLPDRPYLLRPVAFDKQIYLQNGGSKLYNVNREGIQYKLSDLCSSNPWGHSFKVILVNHVENLLSLKTFVPPPSSGEAEVRYVSSRDAIHEILTRSTSCCGTDTEQQRELRRERERERKRIRLLNHGCLPCWATL